MLRAFFSLYGCGLKRSTAGNRKEGMAKKRQGIQEESLKVDWLKPLRQALFELVLVGRGHT